MEASLGSASFLIMSTKTVAKPTFSPVFFGLSIWPLCYFHVFLCVLGCHSLCKFLLHNKTTTNMGVVVSATFQFLVVIYISRFLIKSDPSTPSMPLIATRKRVTLSISSCEIQRSVCLFCEVVPPTLTLNPSLCN